MKSCSVATNLAVAVAACYSLQAAAIESQALEVAKGLSEQVHQVLVCGGWKQGQAKGHYRIVLLNVSFGAGTEVYVQRIQEEANGSGLAFSLIETLSVRELNNDHAQYQVVSARCVGTEGRSGVDLLATFEHDEQDIQHRIRISLSAPGRYEITGVVGQKAKRR